MPTLKTTANKVFSALDKASQKILQTAINEHNSVVAKFDQLDKIQAAKFDRFNRSMRLDPNSKIAKEAELLLQKMAQQSTSKPSAKPSSRPPAHQKPTAPTAKSSTIIDPKIAAMFPAVPTHEPKIHASRHTELEKRLAETQQLKHKVLLQAKHEKDTKGYISPATKEKFNRVKNLESAYQQRLNQLDHSSRTGQRQSWQSNRSPQPTHTHGEAQAKGSDIPTPRPK